MDLNYYKQYEPIFGAWKITRLIGEGSFGKVFEMEREDFGVTYKAALTAITVPANESEVREVMSAMKTIRSSSIGTVSVGIFLSKWNFSHL